MKGITPENFWIPTEASSPHRSLGLRQFWHWLIDNSDRGCDLENRYPPITIPTDKKNRETSAIFITNNITRTGGQQRLRYQPSRAFLSGKIFPHAPHSYFADNTDECAGIGWRNYVKGTYGITRCNPFIEGVCYSYCCISILLNNQNARCPPVMGPYWWSDHTARHRQER